MTYQEALATSKKENILDNYLMITIRYDVCFVLPYKEGVALLQTLGKAEQLYTPYQEKHRINGIDTDTIKVNIMPASTYRHYKIAALMGLTIDEVIEAEKQSKEAPNAPT